MLLPKPHIEYLRQLKREGFEPKVIYDIGACLFCWTREAKILWPGATFILFDALEQFVPLWQGHQHHVGVLSDSDERMVKFYFNVNQPGGNSYYKERNYLIFPPGRFVELKTARLDTVVKQRGFPLPDLVKIDVQGSEHDVIAGGQETISNAQHLIVEMQHELYNLGSPLVGETLPYIESLGWKCIAPLFSCDDGPDGDYDFVRSQGDGSRSK